jgi:nucleoside-diphosphate-sugar epimerase
VHIDECADLYLVLWDALRANPDAPGAGWAGFYFGESGSHSLLELAEAVGAALVAAGKAKDAAPTTFTKAELDEYFGGSAYLGTNCRCRAERARALGWKPVRSTKDLLASVGPEVEAILASGKMEINLH